MSKGKQQPGPAHVKAPGSPGQKRPAQKVEKPKVVSEQERAHFRKELRGQISTKL